MTLVQVHRGHVSEAGKLTLDDRDGFSRAMHGYAGKEVEVVVRRPKAQRSNPQNRYLHGVVLPILAEFAAFIDAVLMFAAADLGVVIPAPNEVEAA